MKPLEDSLIKQLVRGLHEREEQLKLKRLQVEDAERCVETFKRELLKCMEQLEVGSEGIVVYGSRFKRVPTADSGGFTVEETKEPADTLKM